MKTWPGELIADNIEQFQPAQQGMGSTASAGGPQAAGQPAAAPAQPQPQGDQFPGQEVGPADLVSTQEYEGGFADELPDQPAATMEPADEAHIVDLLRNRHDDEAVRFAAAKGFSIPNLADVATAREKHGRIGDALEYVKPVPLGDDGAAGAFARGVIDVPTAGFADELHGLAEGVKKAVTGTQSEQGFWHDVHVADDVYSGRVDRDEAEHPLARISGQLLGGLAIPLSYEGIGLRAGTLAMREAGAGGMAAKEALTVGRRAAARAVTKAMMRDGVIVGGAHGVGSGEGVAGRAGEGLLEAGLGIAGGAVAGKVGEVVAPRLVARAAASRAAPLTEEQQLIQAADRQGVDVLPADVGGPVTRRATSMVSQTIAGGQPVIKAAQQMTEQARAARDRVAASIGQALEREAAGQQALTGAKQAIRTTADDARVFYTAAEKATVGERILTPKAISVLDRNIAELGETPGGAPGLSVLQGLRESLDNGRLTVAGVRRMRTILRDQFIKDGLTGSDLERRVNQVVDAAAQDVQDQLRDRGAAAAAANFAKGDAAWRARAKLIDDVIEPIIGKKGDKSGEAVIKTLTADLQGNNARAVKFLNTLPDSEKANVRASVIGALGRSRAGKQGSEGENFSLDTFLTNWNQVGESAKAAYFGPEGRAALNDLAKIAEGTREAQGYRNMSNTGGVVGNLLTLFSGVGGPLTFAKVVGAQYGLGRLLASPRFARWLARAPKTKMSPPTYIERLGSIAKSEPAIAGDILSLQQRLTEAFRAQPMRAAADDKTDSGQSPQ